MLPKLANTILHSTGRLAAAIPSQTPTLRKVLELQSSGPSGRNDQAPGASRRNLPIPPPTRTRSSSLSNPTTGSTRSERTEKLGVLRTVQIHTRSRHVFAPTSDAADLDIVATLPIPPKASTLTPEQTPAKEQTTATKQTKVKEQTKVTDQKNRTPTPRQIIYEELRLASNKVDRNGVAAAIRRLKTQSDWVIAEYNMVLQALASVRREGEPLTAILDVYNEMLAKSIMPNVRTYLILLRIFIARDAEVQRLETVLEARLKRHEITGRLEKVDMEEEKKRMAVLKSETNFASALTLFDQLIAMGSNDKLDLLTYRALLRGCAHYGNIDSAIHVFGQIEKRERHLPDSVCYMFLLRTFVNGKDLEGAEAVFTEYQEACRDGRVYVQDQEGRDHMRLWNLMVEAYLRLGAPEKAVEIIETMFAAPAKEGVLDTPNPSSSTFTSAITGFCESGDMDTAISWFDRLLEQGKVTDSPWTSLVGEPTKPDMVAWGVMLDALAQRGMVDDLNRLFGRLLENQEGFKVQVRPADRVLVIAANLNNLAEVPKEEAMKRLDFVNRVWSDDLPSLFQIQAVTEVSNGYIAHGAYEQVDAPLQRLTDIVLRAQAKAPEAVLYSVVRRAQASTIQLTDALYSTVSASYALPWNVAGRLAELHALLGMAHKHRQAPELVRSYLAACEAGSATVLNGKWFVPVLDAALYMLDGTLLARVGTTINVSPEDISRLVKEMVTAGNVNLSKTMEARIVKALSTVYSTEQLQVMLEGSEGIMTGLVEAAIKAKEEATKVNLELDEARREAEEARIKAREEKAKEGKQVRYDEAMNKTIGSLMLRADDARVRSAYATFERGLSTRRVPSIYVISRLLMALGRMQEVEKVQKIYSVVHEHIVPTIPEDKRWDAWFTIEEAMVIALGHAGDIDSAHVHRMRILEQGRAPSADAYAILIQLVKDTTDDTSNAMALYQESQAHGVVPNLFLYNNIISKLSKARKADYALELFQQMKMNNVYPSSITYGAIIGACARVGDAESAENLFAEMVNARNFKPRIPPYNTMIQLYTTTKPNRERALHYLDTLKAANVQPSAHTYKLVMDAYGTIEPIEVEKMEEVFNEMCNSGIKPQGPQFASLINSYGCAQKNLEKAIEVFNSIPSYNVPEALDAVVFEAMFNVFVVHRRADLNQEYLEKMKQAGVHMTAYIANTLIKSYATVDELDKARDVFESLLDAPVGVAAPNNHAPHNPEQLQVVSPAAPVYREPSTWEAMIRAELGAGNRAEAQALLERLQERQYPEAVFNRISGILVDHTTIAP